MAEANTVKIIASNQAALLAFNQIKLLAAQNTSSQTGTSKSSSGSIGVSYGTDGLLLNLSASGAKGKLDGSDSSYSNTHVNAGNVVVVQSGADTTLRGAVVKANAVIAKVGGNLNIESLQDTSTHTSKNQSLGGSVSIGYGKMSGSLSASQSNTDSNFKSVGEQTGLKAGDGGFQVVVNNNTHLKDAQFAESRGLLSSSSQTSRVSQTSSEAIGTSIGGKTVDVAAGQDITFPLGPLSLCDENLTLYSPLCSPLYCLQRRQ